MKIAGGLVLFGLALPGCASAGNEHTSGTLTLADSIHETPSIPTPASTLSPLASSFDSQYAWNMLLAQVDAGPRVPGSEGHSMTRALIRREMESAGFEVEEWRGTPVTPVLINKTIPVINIIARWKPQRTRKLFFSAHYDTRPVADRSTSPLDRLTPIDGANDGASGVAVLLAMGHSVAAHPPDDVGLVFVFHDVEDMGTGGQFKTMDSDYLEYCLGARQLAAVWRPGDRFEAGINLDMVADPELMFRPEEASIDMQPELVKELWGVGVSLWPKNFMTEPVPMITDDHLPYLNKGMPCINLIDLDFGPWHTPSDTPAACAQSSLYITGTTTLEFVFQRNYRGREKP